MSNGNLVKTAIIALGCSFALVGCGTYNHQASAPNKSAVEVASASSHQSKRMQKDQEIARVASATMQSEKQQTNSASAKPATSAHQVHQLVSSTYHFKFDNAELNDTAKAELDQFASYLSKNPAAKVHIEGYADQKGKPSYNLALGMRRAESIASYLKQQGVSSSQIETRSFGSEKPAVAGSDNEDLAQNRRAVVYFEVESEMA